MAAALFTLPIPVREAVSFYPGSGPICFRLSSQLWNLPKCICSARVVQFQSMAAAVVANIRAKRPQMRAQAPQAMEELENEEAGADSEECELVSRSDVVLGEGSETFNGYLVQAIKNNNGAAVLLLTDVYGYENGDTRDFAYRLACFGYNVLVPDLFRGFPWSKGTPGSELEHWRKQHSPSRVAADIDVATKSLIDYVKEGSKVAIVGFCFGGGRLIETLARDTEGKFTAAAFFYGTRFDLTLASQIKAPILLISGDLDPLSPVDVVKEIEKQVKGSQAQIYSGRGHGFVDHPQTADDDLDSEDAFTVLRHWLHEKLLSSTDVDML